ncbi:flavodoxin family protein [Qipengyuania sp.]|uniref:flavodoxin family protein n=1 Tax=Qipengyuania sp. TaxID=2004515 RepID=UPI003BABD7F7
MINAAILYYSRTGTTQAVARMLGRELDIQPMKIECPRYDGGWFRYLLAGYDSVRGRLPEIQTPPASWSGDDVLLLGAPIWTSYPALPLRSFLESKPALPRRVALFLTHGGHSPPQKAIDFVSDLLPHPLVASLGLQQEQVRQQECDEQIAGFIRKLKQAGGV